MTETQNSKQEEPNQIMAFDTFDHLNFDIVSNFEFRISDFSYA